MPLTVSRYRNTVQNNLCLCKCKNVLVWLSSGYLERGKKKKYFLKPRLFNFLNLEEESQLSRFQNLCGFKVNFNLCSLWLRRQRILAVLAS